MSWFTIDHHQTSALLYLAFLVTQPYSSGPGLRPGMVSSQKEETLHSDISRSYKEEVESRLRQSRDDVPGSHRGTPDFLFGRGRDLRHPYTRIGHEDGASGGTLWSRWRDPRRTRGQTRTVGTGWHEGGRDTESSPERWTSRLEQAEPYSVDVPIGYPSQRQ